MTETNAPKNRRNRRIRFAPAALLGAAAASTVIALSMNGTLAGFVAQITNDTNNAAVGSLAMEETNADGSVICRSNSTDATTNAATCSTINKYGGSTTMVPGTAVATTVKIKNIGSVAASGFTLTPGACSQVNNGSVNGTATDLCSKMQLTLTKDGTTVAAGSGTLTSLNNKVVSLGTLAPNTTATFVFSIVLPTQNTAQAPTADNAYQGLQARQQLVWQFTS